MYGEYYRRHQVKSVHIFSSHERRSTGFRILFKIASVVFLVTGRTPNDDERCLAHAKWKFKSLFPHIADEFTELFVTAVSGDDLNNMLVGRYAYGRMVELEYNGLISYTIV